MRRRLAGAKRIEAVLKPEAAAALSYLRHHTGRTYSAIIEGLLKVPTEGRDVEDLMLVTLEESGRNSPASGSAWSARATAGRSTTAKEIG